MIIMSNDNVILTGVHWNGIGRFWDAKNYILNIIESMMESLKVHDTRIIIHKVYDLFPLWIVAGIQPLANNSYQVFWGITNHHVASYKKGCQVVPH